MKKPVTLLLTLAAAFFILHSSFYISRAAAQPAPADKAAKSKAAKAAARAAEHAARVAEAEKATDVFKKLPDRPVDLENDRNLYMVGYSHLDTQWRWTYQTTIREYLPNTFNESFKLFERFPNFVVNFSGARRYMMMQEYYPEEFERVKACVKAGRWFPAGSSLDETDTLVPSAESLIRNVLYGNEYFRRELGVASDEYMLPDCFGFSAAVPTILAHAGIKGFSTQKLSWGSAVGVPFNVGVWIGVDGTPIIAALDPGAYVGKVTEDISKKESWLKRIKETGEKSGAFVDYRYYGVGDRGGAPDNYSALWIERSLIGKGPVRVIAGRADQMFNDLARHPEKVAKLPRYQGELLLTEHSAGSITSQAFMKRMNRKNELLADAAERAAVAALWLGALPYPDKKLHDAWLLLIGSQMHDILPGTSLPKAYEFSWNDEFLAANKFAAVLESSVGAVASMMDTRAKGTPLVVYNPLSIGGWDVVEATIPAPAGDVEHLVATRLISSMGGEWETPVQILSRDGDKIKIAFVAIMVEPVSFTVFDIHPATKKPKPSLLTVSKEHLENENYRVTIAPTGDVSSIFDKDAKRELLAGPAQLEFLHEQPRIYAAWNMDWKDRQKPARAVLGGPAKITVVENGPVRVAVRVEREAEGSKFVQTIRLAADGNCVEYVTQIDWRTPKSSLKAAFKLANGNPVATYDAAVGTVQRGNNNEKKYEVPQQQWFDVTAPDDSFGVAILNDSKYGSDKPTDDTIRLTLLYTPTEVPGRHQDQASQDFGRHEMLYAVTSHNHKYKWRLRGVSSQAARLNQPLLAFTTPQHDGALGKYFSLFRTRNGLVPIMAIKKAENSDEIIVRFREDSGQPRNNIRLVPPDEPDIIAAREVDGQERTIGEAILTNGKLEFDIGGYGLKAFALKLAAMPAEWKEELKAAQITCRPIPLNYNEDVISTNANRSDGSFDAEGRTYPAEQLPAKITSENIEFTLGPTADGKPNAMSARGQTIALPAGKHNRLYFLAAADGDRPARFAIDGKPTDLTIQNWSGFIGQWDNRIWEGEIAEVVFDWTAKFAGLVPGFTKRDIVAWYASHHHNPAGDAHYEYCYLFKYGIDLPPGAKTLTLPNDPKIRIFAITVANNPQDAVRAAAPLYDTLEREYK